ncbi:MAG: glycosyltransferase family 25 protein [Bacteroidota bacterium]
MRVNEAFDKVVYINSKRRADRYIRMLARLHEREIEAERVEAVWGGTVNPASYKYDAIRKLTLPEIGCFLSHRGIYERIKAEGWERTLILEDDAEFCDGFEGRFSELYASIPADWDMLYLGRWNFDYFWTKADKARGEFIGLIEEIHPQVWVADVCWHTHAYAINQKCIDFLLRETEVIRNCIDGQLASLHHQLKVYAIHPAIIEQDDSVSSIQNVV